MFLHSDMFWMCFVVPNLNVNGSREEVDWDVVNKTWITCRWKATVIDNKRQTWNVDDDKSFPKVLRRIGHGLRCASPLTCIHARIITTQQSACSYPRCFDSSLAVAFNGRCTVARNLVRSAAPRKIDESSVQLPNKQLAATGRKMSPRACPDWNCLTFSHRDDANHMSDRCTSSALSRVSRARLPRRYWLWHVVAMCCARFQHLIAGWLP